MARKTKAEQIADIPIETLVRMGGETGINTLRGYLKTLRYGYLRRIQSFRRQGDEFSYAEHAFNKSRAKETSKTPVSKLNRNQLILEIARHQAFFNNKTSSIEGIRKVNREQDVRIFGADSRGRPLQTMTKDERKAYWDLYNEFMNSNAGFKNEVYSGKVQWMLRDAIYDEENGKFNSLDLADKLRVLKIAMNHDGQMPDIDEMLKEYGEIPDPEKVGNVYSGRRNPDEE